MGMDIHERFAYMATAHNEAEFVQYTTGQPNATPTSATVKKTCEVMKEMLQAPNELNKEDISSLRKIATLISTMESRADRSTWFGSAKFNSIERKIHQTLAGLESRSAKIEDAKPAAADVQVKPKFPVFPNDLFNKIIEFLPGDEINENYELEKPTPEILESIRQAAIEKKRPAMQKQFDEMKWGDWEQFENRLIQKLHANEEIFKDLDEVVTYASLPAQRLFCEKLNFSKNISPRVYAYFTENLPLMTNVSSLCLENPDPSALQKVAESLTNLRSFALELNRSVGIQEIISPIVAMPRLASLELSGRYIDDKFMKGVLEKKWENLEEIRFLSHNLDEESFRNLIENAGSNLPKLGTIRFVPNARITAEQAQSIIKELSSPIQLVIE